MPVPLDGADEPLVLVEDRWSFDLSNGEGPAWPASFAVVRRPRAGEWVEPPDTRILDPYTIGSIAVRYVLPPDWAGAGYRDGRWPELARLPYDVVEQDGFTVPLWRPDPERLEWEARYPAGSDARRRRLRGEMGLR